MSGRGIKTFEQLTSGATPMLEQMQKEGLSWLQVPAFGYAREHQEHYQKMALAFVDFQEALKKYNALIMQSSQRSFEILELKLAERSEPGRQIDSVRALYDLWVDAAEEAYAEVALSAEFRAVYGDVVNSQMRVRSQLQQEVERIGVDLGMPTRTELNSVHKRLHDLRRELRASQEANGHDGRDAELAAMRAEIDDLRRLVANPAAVARPVPAANAAVPKRSVVRPARSASRRKRMTSKRKRVAAKRTHVAVKRSAGVLPPPPIVKPVPVAVKRTSAAPAERGARRRPAGRVAQPERPAPERKAVSSAKDKRQEKTKHDSQHDPVVSFGDAIAAMREQMSHKRGKKKKAKGARLSFPFKTSRLFARPRRSKP
jgi:hypothetical protein